MIKEQTLREWEQTYQKGSPVYILVQEVRELQRQVDMLVIEEVGYDR